MVGRVVFSACFGEPIAVQISVCRQSKKNLGHNPRSKSSENGTLESVPPHVAAVQKQGLFHLAENQKQCVPFHPNLYPRPKAGPNLIYRKRLFVHIFSTRIGRLFLLSERCCNQIGVSAWRGVGAPSSYPSTSASKKWHLFEANRRKYGHS